MSAQRIAIENENIADGSPFDMFKNDLVIVTAEGSDIEEITLEDAVSGDYSIAIGDANVPAGNYARQTLASVGCYTDENGKEQTLNADGLLAIAIQHELDHLEGKLFIDYLSKVKRDMIIRRVEKERRWKAEEAKKED